ncbi:SURF1 family protein [Aliiglaciecola sp. LCG003]|uniref:SURF1 family protein n=1 Tax=Aliiglaciecola sp. LCG003 TaxID=3053655 RepID=UPI00257224F7|nr:SURF1 family protein [Aliiglaciecola sp. LCG003]WJG09341.1 SURF1 family protein [Aliiglaciecola sp. LCG003]
MADNSTTSSDQKHPYITTVFIIFVVAVLCALGWWQVQRGQHKSERLAQIELRQQASDIGLQSLLNLDDKRDVPFSVEARPLSEKLFLLDNRTEAGKVGYHVLLPVRTAQGLLMVNLGWVQGGQYRDQVPEITIPPERTYFIGTSSVPSVNPMVTETATLQDKWPIVLQSIDLPFMSKFLDERLLPVIMQLDPQHHLGFSRNWKPVVMSPQKHYAYAMQWFGLAIACMVIYLVAIRKRKVKKDV